MKLTLRKTFSFFFCAALINSALAQTTIYTQTFTGGLPAGWQKNDLSTNNAGNWQYTTGKPLNWTNNGGPGARPVMTSSSSGYMLFDSNGQNAGTDDGKAEKADLISTAINLSGFNGTILQFQHFAWHVDSDTNSVWISTDGTNFTKVWECYDYALCGGDWGTGAGRTENVDISAVADGQSTVYVKFRWVGNYDLFWAVDDIKITGNVATGIAVNSFSDNLEIFENPVNSELRFKLEDFNTDAYNVKITDITGKIIGTYPVNNEYESINVENLSSGIYFAAFISSDKITVKKFIKN